jgi:D-beta-D-heptose 7-phosphate kinase / D-beta-D-heptose 1-phosphate adenosyltransferase
MHLEPGRLKEMITGMRDKRVLILGDVMLDRYERGEVARLSPEAPVPVLRKVEQHDVPGGAANVAMNVRSLGGRPVLLGVVGRDPEAGLLDELLRSAGVDSRMVADGGRPTTLKTRFAHKTQQFLRLDRELTEPVTGATFREIVDAAREAATGCDCAMFSDYAKGFFTRELASELCAVFDAAGIPLVVDPKPSNAYLCESCRLFMPNRSEGIQLAGPATVGTEGGAIAESLAVKFGNDVILTDGANGMFVASPGGGTHHIRSKAFEVFDVSGAGDTAAAAVALAVGAGNTILEAAALANEAAGVAVSKLGTAVVRPGEIVGGAGGGARVLERDELAAEVENLKRAGKRVVFTNGCFDILHIGHVRYLEAARALGDTLVIGVNTDASVRRIKGGGRPLIGEMQRAGLLAALQCVDLVTLFDEDTPVELIDRIRPHVFVKGGDYTEERLPEAEVVRSYGGTVEIVPLFGDGVSTTRLIERIRLEEE